MMSTLYKFFVAICNASTGVVVPARTHTEYLLNIISSNITIWLQLVNKFYDHHYLSLVFYYTQIAQFIATYSHQTWRATVFTAYNVTLSG